MYEKNISRLCINVISTAPKIKFSTMIISPHNKLLSVKNTKHHATFNTPFTINSMISSLSSLSFFTAKYKYIANATYITVHTIGITMFGTHSVGLTKVSNQSIPKFTKIEPSAATNTTAPILKIMFNVLFCIIHILCYKF